MRRFIHALLVAAGLTLLAAVGLGTAMSLDAGPAVDFSTAGTACTADKDCLPAPDFTGVSCECWPDGHCREVKYLTNAERYQVFLAIDALFGFSPVCGLLLALGLTRREATQQVLFGRSSSKAAVALVYGSMALAPWLVWVALVGRW